MLAGTYDDTVRDIGVRRSGCLRHPTEHVLDGDLARFTFKEMDSTMTDVFVHLVSYQRVTPVLALEKLMVLIP